MAHITQSRRRFFMDHDFGNAKPSRHYMQTLSFITSKVVPSKSSSIVTVDVKESIRHNMHD